MKIIATILVVWLALAGGASAEDVTVYTRSGAQIGGELVEYVKDKYLLINTSAGQEQPMRFAANDVASLMVEGGRPKSCDLQATARLKTGQAISGVLMEYAKYKYVSLSAGTSEATQLQNDDLTGLAVEGGFGPRCESVLGSEPTQAASEVRAQPTPAAQLSEVTRAALIQGLLAERVEWEKRDTGLAAPVVFTLLGALGLGVGVGLQLAYLDSGEEPTTKFTIGGDAYLTTNDPYDAKLRFGSDLVLATGAGFLTAGIVLFLLRTSDARQQRELDRVDGQLRILGANVRLTPEVSSAAGSVKMLLTF